MIRHTEVVGDFSSKCIELSIAVNRGVNGQLVDLSQPLEAEKLHDDLESK